MHSVTLLDPFIGKTTIDIVEFEELDAHHLNQTYIKIVFDDDTFICFPLELGSKFWFKT